MNDTMGTANVMVDLDSILDTRLSVLYAIHKDTALEVLGSGYYQKRVKDVFGNIAYSIFQSYYKRRNKEVLKITGTTPMIDLLVRYCTEACASMVASCNDRIPKLIINTYPYELNKEESYNILKLFSSLIDVKMDIDLVYLSNSELTPEYVLNNVSTFIKYDMLTWLECTHASGLLSKHPLITVSCVGPLLANGGKTTKEITQKDFDDLRASFGPYTNLVLLQIRMFSAG